MSASGPRILVIGGTYRAVCVLERLLERGERVVAFIGVEGGGERDFCPEILEICARAGVPARSGHKLGEEMVRWLEDRIRPDLAIAVGPTPDMPLSIGGNCRHGMVEALDRHANPGCPGVTLRQRGQEVLRRALPALAPDEDAGDAYLCTLEALCECVEEFLDRLAPAVGGNPAHVPYESDGVASEHLAELVARPEARDETEALERQAATWSARIGARVAPRARRSSRCCGALACGPTTR
jgi:hypothetical protein